MALDLTTALLAELPVSPSALAVAAARVLPSAVLVPAFGLRALPVVGRAVVALVLALALVPAIASEPAVSAPLVVVLAGELSRGALVAVAAAVPLWSAAMAGDGLALAVGFHERADAAVVSGGATSFGVLTSLFASAAFLASGGASRLAQALTDAPIADEPVARVVSDLTGGIAVGVALAAPLLGAMVVVDLTRAVVSRASLPVRLDGLLAPLRTLTALVLLALVFDRVTGALGRIVR